MSYSSNSLREVFFFRLPLGLLLNSFVFLLFKLPAPKLLLSKPEFLDFRPLLGSLFKATDFWSSKLLPDLVPFEFIVPIILEEAFCKAYLLSFWESGGGASSYSSSRLSVGMI